MSSTRVLNLSVILRAMNNMTSKAVLAANLRKLMDTEQLSEAQTAKKTGVSQKGINKILNQETSAGIDLIEKVAKAFKITTSQLLTPNIDKDEIELINSYRLAPDQAKHMIRSVADAAAPYSGDK